jgi:hypothetical protein
VSQWAAITSIAEKIEPICAVLPIAPSLYYGLEAREREPARPGSQRTRRGPL